MYLGVSNRPGADVRAPWNQAEPRGVGDWSRRPRDPECIRTDRTTTPPRPCSSAFLTSRLH